MNTFQSSSRPRRRPTLAACPPTSRGPVLAREQGGDYDADEEHADTDPARHHHTAGQARRSWPGHDDELSDALRDRIETADRAVREALTVATDPGQPSGGELGGLLHLLATIDRANALAVELTATAQRDGLSERSSGLPLDGLLSLQSRATYGDRRMLINAAEQLQTLPNLRAAFHAGVVGWAEVRTILAEVRRLSAEQRALVDAAFVDHGRLRRLEADELVGAVQDAVGRLRPDLETKDAQRVIEHRFVWLQPDLHGGGRGYFELDPTGFATVAAAIEAALPPPSAGPNDITRDAPDHGHLDEQGDSPGDVVTPEGDPGFCDPLVRRTRARQRADGLVNLAEVFLAGANAWPGPTGPTGPGNGDGHLTSGNGTPRSDTAGPTEAGAVRAGPLKRARPSVQAVCDIAHLAGHDAPAQAARALVASLGGHLRLTPEAVRRLACDATLQLVFTDQGEVLGTTEPTDDIPIAVRRAVRARDQGCRFPGCRMPVAWSDVHHVTFRADGGPTMTSNLVMLCRRHHTAVHEGGWKLSLDPDGTVHVRRGRRRHTSDPPLRRTLLPA